MFFKRAIWVLFFLISSTSYALDLELTQGINSALPIAVNSFGGSPEGVGLKEIISNDLRLSGQFKLIDLVNGEEGQNLVWRQTGAESIVKGEINKIGSDRYAINFELLDAIAQGKVLLSQSFQVTNHELRALAHHISDLVYEKLTGERGVFSTRIAYVLVQRQGGKTTHYLEVADADGYNPQNLLTSSSPLLSPAWSPDGQKIAYVSFEKKKAQIFIVDVASGRRQLITNFNGINSAPAWSPDGRELAVVLSKGGSPKIYTVDLNNGNLKQLTFGGAIDTEPRFSSDGRLILFTSDRGGSPQIYQLDRTTSAITRLTYEGNYNARASYTPDKKHLIMLHRDEDKRFNIGVQDLASSTINSLTFSAADESPSVSPNGRLILYATRYNDQGVLGIVSLDGRIRLRLPAREGDVQEPAWSPFL